MDAARLEKYFERFRGKRLRIILDTAEPHVITIEFWDSERDCWTMREGVKLPFSQGDLKTVLDCLGFAEFNVG